ncbi:MAG: hypothetical protein ACREMW_11220 [Gemmatimonadales bacterium]
MPIDFAILAPVPLVHLESALTIAGQQPYVAFGSRKYELFEAIDRDRGSELVPVLIYPSHDEDRVEFDYKVSWSGWYVGSCSDQETKFADQRAGRRPPSAKAYPNDNASFWSTFWHVAALIRLPQHEHREIRDLNNFRTGAERENAAPRGPERILSPFGFTLPPKPRP